MIQFLIGFNQEDKLVSFSDFSVYDFISKDLRATPDMKTEVAPTTNTSTTTTTTATTTSRIVSTGAVVCLELLFILT